MLAKNTSKSQQATHSMKESICNICDNICDKKFKARYIKPNEQEKHRNLIEKWQIYIFISKKIISHVQLIYIKKFNFISDKENENLSHSV